MDVQSEVLEDLRSAVNYRSWICQLADPWLGDSPLELGSGLGDYAYEWATEGRVVTASEANVERVHRLEQRFTDNDAVHVRRLAAPVDEGGTYSAVVAINVLEHIDDDVAALRSFARLVRPGGNVVVLVPAFPAAMSDFDREIGHFRRYRRSSLAGKMRLAGLEPAHLHYVNAPGIIAWTIVVRLLRRRPRDGILLRVFDSLVPWLARLEDGMRPPFGQSVFAVARVG